MYGVVSRSVASSCKCSSVGEAEVIVMIVAVTVPGTVDVLATVIVNERQWTKVVRIMVVALVMVVGGSGSGTLV